MISEKKKDGETISISIGESQININKALSENGTKRKSSDTLKSKSKKKKFGSVPYSSSRRDVRGRES